nr:YicC/YloC family endoribonuclease [Gottfriedia endophytica]
MVVSMTGYGKAILTKEQVKIHIEMKSVNHRYLETILRMPRQLMPYEEPIKKIVSEYTNRGRVELFITIEGMLSRKLVVDEELLTQYKNVLNQLQLDKKDSKDYSAIELLKLPEVTTITEVEQIEENFGQYLFDTVHEACNQFRQMKEKEGTQLKKDVVLRLNSIEESLEKIKPYAPNVIKSYQNKLQAKLNEVLNQSIDEQRLLAEVMIFADRSDITEEQVRLKSHIEMFNETLQLNESIGRKLDFIVQEMNREINTIGSKANDILISKLVIEMKNNLEKIREQVQNIE